MIQSAKRIESIGTYYFAKKLAEIKALEQAGQPIINLGIGSPDMPPAPEVIEALSQTAQQDHVHGYQSYYGIPELRLAFAEWYDRHFKVELDASTEILPLIGSKEGVMHISMAYLDAGDHVLVPNPGYPAYAATAKIAGAEVVLYDLTAEGGWLPDLEKIAKENDLTKVKIMWINYPHMPTGAKATCRMFEQLIAFAKEHQILICHDNPYIFIQNESPMSILQFEGAKEVCLELISLSKCYNMAGWRIGAVHGKKEFLDPIVTFKSNMDSGMFRPLQEAAIVALKLGQDWIASLNQEYGQRKHIAHSIFDHLGLSYDADAAGLFVWGKIDGPIDAYGLSDQILEQAHVFITPGAIFGSNGDQYLRISLCSPMDRLETALQQIKNANI